MKIIVHYYYRTIIAAVFTLYARNRKEKEIKINMQLKIDIASILNYCRYRYNFNVASNMLGVVLK